ncbi:MAG: carbohydrate ABC transporter permease [Clostridia bacterium]|nr:carbohydrate ABC transporter permease [Clostridia bacterium]
MKKRLSVWQMLNYIILFLICVTTIYPFIYLLLSSFSPIEDILKHTLLPVSKNFNIDAYRYVFQDSSILDAYKVTIFITVMGTAIGLLMSALGAYVLSQPKLPGKKLFMGMIIVTMVFHGGMIPSFLVVRSLGLYDSLWALILPTSINTFWMLIMRNSFQSLPASISESARIDGCSEFRILFMIVLPLSGPILATLGLFYGVNYWNMYSNAVIYINSSEKRPLQMLIKAMYQSASSTMEQSDNMLPPAVENLRAATIMVATLPILCVYPFLQKYFVKGVTVGAVKG